jgi:hypothetical protein
LVKRIHFIAERLAILTDVSFRARAVLGLTILGLLLADRIGAVAGSSDTSGYMNDARLLASGNLHPSQRLVAGVPSSHLPYMAYVPLGFLPLNEAQMYPTYPMGLPLVILGSSAVFGWDLGPNVAMWVLSMACILAMYYFCIEGGLGRELSMLGSLFLGSSPLFLFMSLQAMSDVPATFCAVISITSALKAAKHNRWSILSGFACFLGYVIRPTGLLMLLPVALLLPRRRKVYLSFLLGGLPWILWSVTMNRLLYGHIFTTGYGDVGSLFKFRYLWPTLCSYSKWIPIELTPLIFLALGFPIFSRVQPLMFRLAIVAWISLLLGFYSFYQYTHETWWYLRFVLPAYPALIFCMLVILKAMISKWQHLRYGAWCLLLAFTVAWNYRASSKLAALDSGRDERIYASTCKYINSNLPRNAVYLCMQESGALTYYTKNQIIRWDRIAADNFPSIVNACQMSSQPIYMVLFSFEENEALTKFPGAHWQSVANFNQSHIWRLVR